MSWENILKKKPDLFLPRGTQKILQAEDKKNNRGLLVELLKDGGYEVAYWKDEYKPYPIEILVDGKSQLDFLIRHKIVNKDAKVLGKGSISGVSLEKFNPSDEIRLKLRKKLNISDDQWVFMYLGRLKRDKGILDLVDAFLKINNRKNALLYLVGDDEENLVKNLKL